VVTTLLDATRYRKEAIVGWYRAGESGGAAGTGATAASIPERSRWSVAGGAVTGGG